MGYFALLVQNNHPANVIGEYGLSFFIQAIESIYQEKEEHIKHMAIAVRLANADDKTFNSIVNKKEHTLRDDELFSL